VWSKTGTEVGSSKSSKQHRSTASLLLQTYCAIFHFKIAYTTKISPNSLSEYQLNLIAQDLSIAKMGLPEKIETRLFINGEVSSLLSIGKAPANLSVVCRIIERKNF
jgi:hypothetical protein